MVWTAIDIPDLTGKIIVITGANSGIGEAATIELVKKGANVIIGCRNIERGEEAQERIHKAVTSTTGVPDDKNDKKVKFIRLDLSDFKSIEEFTTNFKKQYNHLDILINNAGLMAIPYSKTKDGFETQFGVNHIGHFLLTNKLMDYLMKKKGSRIVNVSSSLHRRGNPELMKDFNTLNPTEQNYNRWTQYANSKLANILFTNEIDKRLKEKKKNNDLMVVSCHPGWTATELQPRASSDSFILRWTFPIANYLFAMKPEQGCLPTLYAATSSNVKSGKYYGPDGWFELSGYPKEQQPEKMCFDEKLMKSLWDESEKMTKIKFTI